MTANGIMSFSAKSKNKLVGVAVASGLVAASLSGVEAPAANAWCVGLSGLPSLGNSTCTSTFGTFSLGLGPNANAASAGFLTGAIAVGDAFAQTTGVLTAALAGGTGSAALTAGIGNWAMALGTNVLAEAGTLNTDFANVAFNFGTALVSPFDHANKGRSVVEADHGGFNVAANFFGNANAGAGGGPNDLYVISGGSPTNSGGYGTFALNFFGDRNVIEAWGGFLDTALNVGNPFGYPNGSDTNILVGLTAPANLSLGFNVQPPFITEPCTAVHCGNTVTTDGTLAFAGAFGLANRLVEVTGPGISVKTPLNPVAAASPVSAVSPTTLAASGPQKNTAGPSLNSNTAANVSKVGTSARSGRSALNSVSKQITPAAANSGNAVSKTGKNATGGLATGVKVGLRNTAGSNQ